MSETTAEYKVKTKEIKTNTVILTEESDGINSKDYWGYALTPFLFPDKVDEREIVIGVRLVSLLLVGEIIRKRILILLLFMVNMTKRVLLFKIC